MGADQEIRHHPPRSLPTGTKVRFPHLTRKDGRGTSHRIKCDPRQIHGAVEKITVPECGAEFRPHHLAGNKTTFRRTPSDGFLARISKSGIV